MKHEQKWWAHVFLEAQLQNGGFLRRSPPHPPQTLVECRSCCFREVWLCWITEISRWLNTALNLSHHHWCDHHIIALTIWSSWLILGESVGRSVLSDSLLPHGLEPSRLLCPWGFFRKNTGVGCLSLLQGIFPTHVSCIGGGATCNGSLLKDGCCLH